MSKATFYLLTAEQSPQQIACLVAARAYRQGQRAYLLSATQADAEQLDEQLWQFEADSFIPHNLVGEGPAEGAPVELGWTALTTAVPTNRPLLVNLALDMPNFAVQFAHVIDFVPADEQGKAQARKRFAQLRQLGVTPTTIDLATQPF